YPPRSSDRRRKLAAPLQFDQAACLTRLQATSTRGVRDHIRCVGGDAKPSGSASHASETASLKLTFVGDPPPTKTCPACLSDDLTPAARKCKHCGSNLSPA